MGAEGAGGAGSSRLLVEHEGDIEGVFGEGL